MRAKKERKARNIKENPNRNDCHLFVLFNIPIEYIIQNIYYISIQTIPVDKQNSCECSQKEDNIKKNRYKNIITCKFLIFHILIQINLFHYFHEYLTPEVYCISNIIF